MNASGNSKADVLVVGAGPTGLTMACELARHGIAPRIIDKAPAPSDKSKAFGIHARTLELFEVMGIADTVLGRAPEELAGKALSELSHAEDRGAFDEGRARLHAGEIDRFSVEKRYLRPDGQDKPGATAATWSVAAEVRAGTFWINGYKTISVMSPFGGFGQSGYGRSSGIEALHAYTTTKSVWVETSAAPVSAFGYSGER